MPNAPLTLIGRILISFLFPLAGVAKLANPAAFADSIGGPVLMTWLVGIFEIVAGTAVLVGFQTRLAAAVLAVFCIASGLIAHFDPADRVEMVMFMKNLAMAGGFLILVAAGPGKWSIDGRRV